MELTVNKKMGYIGGTVSVSGSPHPILRFFMPERFMWGREREITNTLRLLTEVVETPRHYLWELLTKTVRALKMSNKLLPVSFHNDTLFIVEHNQEAYTPVKPIIKNMGLDWASQYTKLQKFSERWTIVMITTVAEDGRDRETLCMPVRKLPAFLATINPSKVKPHLREKIITYQNECDDVLWNYWSKGHALQSNSEAIRAVLNEAVKNVDEKKVLIDHIKLAQIMGMFEGALICAENIIKMKETFNQVLSQLEGECGRKLLY